MSKNIKTTALVLVLLLAFLCGFGMGKNRGFNLNYNVNPTGTTAPAEAKPVNITTEPQAESTDKPAQDDAKKPAVKPAPKKAPTTPKDVVAAYNNAVNTAKQREKLTVVKTRTLDLTPGDTKPSLAKGAVKSALEKAVQPLDETTFAVDKDSEQSAEALLSPAGRYANLKLSGVAAAKAKKTDTGYSITIKLNDETARLKNGKPAGAKMHNASLSAIDPTEIKAFGLKPQNMKLQYSGGVIRATIDRKGRLTSCQYTLPFTGKMTGKYFFSALNTSFEGTITESVKLSYSK